jgi:hypothetical protein
MMDYLSEYPAPDNERIVRMVVEAIQSEAALASRLTEKEMYDIARTELASLGPDKVGSQTLWMTRTSHQLIDNAIRQARWFVVESGRYDPPC